MTTRPLPLQISAGHMANQSAARAGFAIEKQWEMAGLKLGAFTGNERGEGITLDGVVEGREIVFREMIGNVHDYSRYRVSRKYIQSVVCWPVPRSQPRHFIRSYSCCGCLSRQVGLLAGSY